MHLKQLSGFNENTHETNVLEKYSFHKDYNSVLHKLHFNVDYFQNTCLKMDLLVNTLIGNLRRRSYLYLVLIDAAFFLNKYEI